MSSLNSYRILSKKDNIICVEIEMVHPDVNYINDSANFALQIILELYREINLNAIYNTNYSSYPFTQEQGNAMIFPENKPKLDDLLLKMMWRKIVISEEEYNELQKNDYTYQGEKLSSSGFSDGIYHVNLITEYYAFCEQADIHIQKVEVMSVANLPRWFDRLETWLEYGQISRGFDDEILDLETEKNNLNPSYILQITINPESSFLLPHLQEGSFWESAGYNFLEYATDYIAKTEPIYHTLAYNSQIVPPADEALQNWWEGLSEEWKKVFQVNYYVQQHCFFSDIKHNFLGNMIYSDFERKYGSKILEELTQKTPSLQDLRNLSQLKIMILSGADISDLTPLKMLKGLKLLELESMPLKNIDALGELITLEALSMMIYDDIQQSCIKNLINLRDLRFEPKTPEELAYIKNMPNLRKIYGITSFEIDANIFKNMPKLKTVFGQSFLKNEQTKDTENKLIFDELRNSGVKVNWIVEFEENYFKY